jgi:S-adenosylmethionine synthetase
VYVDCFGTNTVPENRISKAVYELFALTPRGIIETLKLRNPIYSATARHGHFGRKPYSAAYTNPATGETSKKKYEFFSWEKTDKADALRKACK